MELDSHANMVVFRNQGTTIQNIGKFADVNAFAEDVGMMSRFLIVDSVVAYDCTYSGEVILLMSRNALFVVSMDHNLVPPFIVREAGLQVNEQAKIHTSEPTKQDHSIWDKESKKRIPLQLDGTFSVSTTQKLTQDEVNNAGDYKVILISPDSNCWNPKCEAWTVMKDEMLYFEVKIRQHDRPKHIELINKYDFDNVSSLDSIRLSGEDYETRVDAIISLAYISDSQDDVTTEQHHMPTSHGRDRKSVV